MTYDVMPEDEIRALLRAASADPPPHVDLLQGLHTTGRARRTGVGVRGSRRIPIPALVSVGSATLAGVGVLAVTAVVVSGVGSAPSAQAEVAAAVDRTAGQSFRGHSVQDNGAVYEGLSDPTRGQGVTTESDGSEWRYVGNTVYARKAGAHLPPGKLWVAEQRPTAEEQAKLPAEALLIKIAPDDPQAAL